MRCRLLDALLDALPALRYLTSLRMSDVRGKLKGLVEAPQLHALLLEMPYVGDVVEELARQRAVMRGLCRLELAALGGVYQHAKRVLWPHVLVLPLQEGVRLW